MAAGPPSRAELIEDLDDAVRMLRDSIRTIRTLLHAHQSGTRVPDAELKRLKRQCAAAAVGRARLTRTLARHKRASS